MNQLKIKTIDEFTRQIEEYVKDYDLDYLDAILYYGDQHGLEVETVAGMVKSSPKIKSAMQREAEKNRVLPRISRLPL